MSEVKKDVLTLVFGQRSVEKWTLRSKSVSVEIISLGCVISAIKALDRKGQSADIVLGFDDLESYLTNSRYFGAVVGRVANRIAKGQFVVEGKVYNLAINNGPSSLHGGIRGFDKGAPDIYDHEVSISAEAYLPVDDNMIPTGEIRPVENSLFDLRKPVLLGSRLKELPGPGFDHNFCLWLPGQHKQEMKCARVVHPGTGRVLELSTTQPGVQFYTSNFLLLHFYMMCLYRIILSQKQRKTSKLRLMLP